MHQLHEDRVLEQFNAYGLNFVGGVRVATGDVNGDNVADIITIPGPGIQTEVRVWDGKARSFSQTPIARFNAFPLGVLGSYIAAGDVDGDDRTDIIVGQGAGGSRVRVFSGASITPTSANPIAEFGAFGDDLVYVGGARVAEFMLTRHSSRPIFV